MIDVNNGAVAIFLFNQNPLFTLQISDIAIYVTIIIAVIVFIISYIRNKGISHYQISELELNFQLTRVKYDINRSYDNIEIAHKIYVELVTRKAAIPLDVNNDIIYEVYNSWYELFKVIRMEIKNIPGKNFSDKSTDQLVKMAVDILNEGLRPHLTKHHAKFRRWYEDELKNDKNKNRSPQDIQKEYPEFESLTKEMLEVNKLLLEYSLQLKKFIKGNEKKKFNFDIIKYLKKQIESDQRQ